MTKPQLSKWVKTDRQGELFSGFDLTPRFNIDWQKRIGSSITDTGNALEPDEVVSWAKAINVEELRNYMIEVGKNTRRILSNLSLEQIKSMVPEEWVMRILEEGGVTTDFRSVWLLVFWGRLTIGGMILTPMTSHYMMHLPTAVDRIIEKEKCGYPQKFHRNN